ncbi:MAG: hypothetical protein RQ751_14470, partial [Longimicrobiales bacterium]|nr:hypothetical protein [Longimicrobiales bacterium]
MSGVCGVVRADGGEVERSWVEAMVEAARWRGPDGTRVHVAGGVGVGHLARHVMPESAGEEQPWVSGELVVVADARIDNRSELSAA